MTKRGNLRNILSAVEELSSEGNEWRKGDKWKRMEQGKKKGEKFIMESRKWEETYTAAAGVRWDGVETARKWEYTNSSK